MIIREISNEEYENFINVYPYSSILQTTEYSKIMANQDHTCIYVGVFKNNILIGASLILIKKIKGYKYAYAPRGFLIDYSDKSLIEEFTKEIKRYLNKMDVTALKLCPPIIRCIFNKEGKTTGINPKYDTCFNNLISLNYHHFGYNSFFEAYKPRFEALIDLAHDYKELFKNIKKEYKTKIRSAEKMGIKIYRANSNEIDLIYEQTKNKYPRDLKYFQDSYKFFSEKNKMEYYYAKLDTNSYLKYIKKQYETIEAEVYELNQELMKNSNNKLISRKMDADYRLSNMKNKLLEANDLSRKYQKGLVLASMLIAKNRSEIYLYMDGFDTMYKKFNAKHLLMWKIIEKYSNLGYKRLNLGGITDIRVENNKFEGLNNFKTNFNSSIVEYAGDFELVINPAKYFLYRQMTRGK
ncbi:MAG TPA: peptidoglycan bridge formation glycyltransferase FemA/FemB family protein [Bacilli bacterium]|nr:peptidoglycan bridge formation glycyltransferase FemA/FemB family protein [Bacilli bacterium]